MDRDPDRAALAPGSEGSFGDSDYRLRGAAAQSRYEPYRSGDFHPRRGRAVLTSATHQADANKLAFATIKPRWYPTWVGV
jgi:hypothetical protein